MAFGFSSWFTKPKFSVTESALKYYKQGHEILSGVSSYIKSSLSYAVSCIYPLDTEQQVPDLKYKLSSDYNSISNTTAKSADSIVEEAKPNLEQQLWYAIACNNKPELLEQLIDNPEITQYLHKKNEAGFTPLEAAKKTSNTYAEKLIRQKCYENELNSKNHFAILKKASDDVGVFNYLFKKLDAKNQNKYTGCKDKINKLYRTNYEEVYELIKEKPLRFEMHLSIYKTAEKALEGETLSKITTDLEIP